MYCSEVHGGAGPGFRPASAHYIAEQFLSKGLASQSNQLHGIDTHGDDYDDPTKRGPAPPSLAGEDAVCGALLLLQTENQSSTPYSSCLL